MNTMLRTLLCGLLLLTLGGFACAEDVIYYQPDKEGFIMDWLVSRLHTYDYAYLGGSMQYDALAAVGGEKNIAPIAGMRAGDGLPWTESHYKAEGWAHGVCEFPGAPMRITYAFVYLYLDKEAPDLSMFTGSDDALLVLLNGVEVQQVQMQRGYSPDQDRKDGVTLKQGWNRFLCKVDDYGGGHGLVCRFKLADGATPFTDYKICLARPKDGAKINWVNGVTYEAQGAALLKEAMKLNAEQGNIAGAEAKCGEVVKNFPKSAAAPESMFQVGRFQTQENKPDEALKTYDALTVQYPYAKWVEDALLARATIYTTKGELPAACTALQALITDHQNSNLVPDAMVELGRLQAQQGDRDNSDQTLQRVRRMFPDTVQSVQALDAQGDNQQARNLPADAKKTWKQVIDEAAALSSGKYVWYVNVQAMLHDIAEGARAKMEGKAAGK